MTTPQFQVPSRFCDYFAICGLDPNSGLEVLSTYEIDGTSESVTCAPLERSYKPKILGHYPESVPWNPFDKDAVRNLSLPDGLLFRTQKYGLDPSFHPFLITRENGSRMYGFSFVFFEAVDSPNVTQAIQTLQAMHLAELSSSIQYHQKRAAQNRNIIQQQKNLHQPRKGRIMAQFMDDDGNNTRSLPRHFKLAAHKQQLTQSFYDAAKDTLYVTKAVALLCPLPFVQAAHQFLQGLYRHARTRNSEDLSIESLVYHLLYYVPLPPPGRSVQVCYWNEQLTCLRPRLSQLPLCDFFFGDLFRLLDLDCVLQLFTCVLLENQVLLYSRDLCRLMLVAECVTAALFPFTWQHVYAPILPSTLHHFLDAPVPYIMGVRDEKDNFPLANLCFVDIDRNVITVPEDLPTFPHRSDLIAELADVLQKYGIPLGNLNKSMKSPYRVRRTRARKNSWSQDSDSGNEESLSINGSQLNLHGASMSSSYHAAYTLQRYHRNPSQPEIFGDVDSLRSDNSTTLDDKAYLRNLKLNNAVREIFCNRFVHMFASYDHFLSQPNEEGSRIKFVHNFDKATFLSDQPDQNLPFLSRFMETQMFASLIDRKIATLSGDAEPDVNLVVFEQRIKLLRDQYGESLIRTPSYEPCNSIKESEQLMEQRFVHPDFIAPSVYEILSEKDGPGELCAKQFPLLNGKYLNCGPTDTRNLRLLREGSTNEMMVVDMSLPSTTTAPSCASLQSVFQPKATTSSPASIAQANWEFIKQLLQDPAGGSHSTFRLELLKECKTKTKRMLVEKMGPEAVALGHGEVSIHGVEENTLVASLCDLLERIWGHGLHIKGKGRSPLWNYLMNFQESEASKDSSKPMDPQFLTPDLSAMASELNLNVSTSSPTRSPEIRGRSRAPELPVITPLPVSISFDVRNVQSISEIKTEIGYARAWIRLSLEKKVLSKHLRALLADDELLRGLYKRTAFLRSEDERDQFLYHLLTLNAADYFCFTNTYINIMLPYRVLIFPSKRFNLSSTTAQVWISVSGTLGETPNLQIPKNTLEFLFQHKNLGLLTNMHIGHDNSGVSPKWLVDYVVIRCDVTGHMIKFPCGRWLGKEVDDGSTERLLVGEPFYEGEECPAESRLRTPPRARSPSLSRYAESPQNPQEIQEALGNAVNRIVKYHFKTDRERGSLSLTVLLCGENGLVTSLEQIFSYGFKSSRMFGRNIYLWDYFCQISEAFAARLRERDLGEEEMAVMVCYCQLIHKINAHASSLGKNGKFQLLICLCAREHLLPHLPPLLSGLQVTRGMYEDHSFLRDPDLLGNLVQVLLALDDYDIVLEQSLSKGIE